MAIPTVVGKKTTAGAKRGKKGAGNKQSAKTDPAKLKKEDPNKKDQEKKFTGSSLPSVIGVPHLSLHEAASKNFLANSMLMGTILPGKMELATGLTVYRIKPKFDEYKEKLKELGLKCTHTNGLRVAVFTDSFSTESFTNDYGESFLASMAGAASGVAGDITQMTGETKATDALKKIGAIAGEKGGTIGKAVEGMRKTAEEKGNEFFGEVAKTSPTAAHAIDTMNKLLGGARVDFPMIWKNSAFNPTYSLTFRLYNPFPANDKAHTEYIVGPLAALLSLGLPVTSDKGDTYSYPYVHQIEFKGYFKSRASAITGMTVTKGAEGLIAHNQRPSFVEIKLDFVNLFNTLVMGVNDGDLARPTLKSYLDNLCSTTKMKKIYTDPPPKKDPKKKSVVVTSFDNSDPFDKGDTPDPTKDQNKVAAGPNKENPDMTQTAPERVPETKKAEETKIIEKDSGKAEKQITETPEKINQQKIDTNNEKKDDLKAAKEAEKPSNPALARRQAQDAARRKAVLGY